MSTPSQNSNSINVTFGRIAATVSVTDMNRALQFYTQVMGMTKIFENGNPVGFVILRKDAGELHLTLSKNHVATDRNVAHLMVDNAKALYEHFEQSGVKIIKGIRDADYGIRGFVLADPDGNRIDVGQVISG
jgi:catechol 2,3-dioxygenase-like lactoylglutathione lyase family enzyme